ncbi:hypothetical protein FJY63_09515, partial [Candidatus Sumerlaeota bacterium]|nr:hypothetical protein [Candidatus Sumerlaeota bacterium]
MNEWRRGILSVLFAALVLLIAPQANAWWDRGHVLVAQAANQALPDDVPRFFRQASDDIANMSALPDSWRNREAKHLREAVYPEHFIDWEMLEGQPLPPTRWEYVALCARLRKNPYDVGLLPYAVVEETDRLACAFAEHRRWPDDRGARQQCAVFAAILSHYAADMAQPLHLTVSYDGRTSPGATSPRTGIHNRVDALLQAVELDPGDIAAHVQPVVFDDPFASTIEAVIRNRSAIATVYALENDLPLVRKGADVDAGWLPTDRLHEFAKERASEAAFLTA